ncbi:MAG: ABC transporter permease [Fusobacterium sp.]|uniref:ABC transporter permease n=1 Tax=Fusobacterium sp. TaxID=68766 RepID=UPI0026DAED02|nr:ABC transporter permease [Fusobacterium sp.]MDO4690300.1 ABC transporter permease [Fusobacterium sp.]
MKKIFNLSKIIILLNLFLILILFFLSKKLNTDINLDKIFMPISSENLLGTDDLGRDILSLLIVGAIKTLKVVLISVSISFFIGSFLGMTSGYFENNLSIFIKSLVDLMMIVPSLISAIIISSIFGINPITAGMTLGIFGIGSYMNQAEALTKREKNKEYIEASIILGVPQPIILYKNIFFNILPQLLINLGNTASSVILQYSALSFIGLGADYTKPDWGTMLYQYRIYLIKKPFLIIFPSLAIFWVSLSFNLLFDKEKVYE